MKQHEGKGSEGTSAVLLLFHFWQLPDLKA
jgi:hypothetical protein